MTKAERRPSLLYGEEEEPQDDRKFRSPGHIVDASLDNTDMLALTTSFDRQISDGHPMYFEVGDDVNDLVAPHFAQSGGNSRHRKALTVSKTGKTVFDDINELRFKYLKESAQDAESNAKNYTESWFLYPKPLPKFWKFEKDKRLQEEIITPTDEMHGYFCTRTTGNDSQLSERFQLHYTGEFFDLSHYAEELKKVTMLRGRSSEVAGTYDDVVDNVRDIKAFGDHFEDLVCRLSAQELDALTVKRIEYLLNRFDLFQQLEGRMEVRESRLVPHRDFYNIRKVDQNFLLSGCVSQRLLNDFIWEKLNLEPDRVVYKDPLGSEFTLRQIFCNGADIKCNEDASIGLKAVDDIFLDWYETVYLSGAHLTGTASAAKDSPMFFAIAKTFLEFDNLLSGEYLAEIVIKYVIQFFEKSKYQLAQLSVDFQFSENWWSKFCEWITRWKLVSYNIRWNVRFNRCYTKLFASGQVQCFQDYLDYIFKPLFEEPSESNMQLQYVLSTVCCFDLVADDSDDYLWRSFRDPQLTPPTKWRDTGDNPPLAYYMFYIYEYLKALNIKRRNNGQNTIVLRNYCPVSKSRVSQFRRGISVTEQFESLLCNALLCGGGLLQAEALWTVSPPLLYVFYLLQIPVIVSPLSSVSLTREHGQSAYPERSPTVNRDVTTPSSRSYSGNPFMHLHKIGLKVVLSSSSVLFNSSYTMEPIIEEYSVAASIYLLTSADMCELVRDSAMTSGYEGFYKAHWNGIRLTPTEFFTEHIGSTDIWFDQEPDTCYKHNVPTTRRLYRQECIGREWNFIHA
ncbi:LADA_0H12574g1_1 [Lachancea dasiensis]|uniref:LADA_0H12574g1_1 n=1 Tax=Lachancea dasiensis TaxID=1072105 RepID=A0A1G4K3W9_9SACH|nr:LADA_0H12574g1_1 [Lachancea dasiensis]